jgi:hypothetical protein
MLTGESLVAVGDASGSMPTPSPVGADVVQNETPGKLMIDGVSSSSQGE